MNDRLAYTVQEIYRLASEYQTDVVPGKLTSLRNIFDRVRTVPYRTDFDSCGEDECLKRPAFGLIEGDCDDKTIIAGAYFNRLGIPWRVKTVSYNSEGEMQHVYPEVLLSGQWMPFDATYSRNKLFTERPYTNSITWENPNMTQRNYGVLSLAGLGFSPMVVLADVDSILSTLQKLPIIGSFFRGKTEHQTYDESLAAQQGIFAQVVDLRRQLNEEGQARLDALAKSFWDNHVVPGWGTWWDAAVQRLYNYWIQQPAWQGQEYRTAWYLSMPVFIFMFNEDKTRVAQSIESWYNVPVKTKVWDPITVWAQGQAQSSTNPYGSGSSSSSLPAVDNLVAGITSNPLVFGALVLGLILAMKKRRRHA